MSDESGRIARLVELELESIPSPYRRRGLQRILIPPVATERDGIACWLVAHEPLKGLLLIYSEQGPDPETRWAFVSVAAAAPESGTNWTWYLEEAYIRSGAWEAPVILFDQARFHVPPSERYKDVPERKITPAPAAEPAD